MKPLFALFAALEAVAYQTLDLSEAMARDGAVRPRELRIDGDMAANNGGWQWAASECVRSLRKPIVEFPAIPPSCPSDVNNPNVAAAAVYKVLQQRADDLAPRLHELLAGEPAHAGAKVIFH